MIRYFWLVAALLTVRSHVGPVTAHAATITKPPVECLQDSEEWNGTAQKTSIMFTNACEKTLNVTLVTGKNGRWHSLMLVPHVRTFAFYKDDPERLNGITPYACYSPAFAVDDVRYEPINQLDTPFLCKEN